MTREELLLIESLLLNLLSYDVCADVMLTDEVKEALEVIDRELRKPNEQENNS